LVTSPGHHRRHRARQPSDCKTRKGRTGTPGRSPTVERILEHIVGREERTVEEIVEALRIA
ncbi:MAG TPA: hypothetical protein VGD91_27530, partial [Trebonia sp.]